MNNNSKAPADSTTGARDTEQHDNHEAQLYSYMIPQANRNGKIILVCLQEGRENALWRRELVMLTGLPDRTFRREVEALRCAGVPILSDDCGYWIANLSTIEGQQEAARFLRQEGSRIRAISRRLDPIRRSVAAAQMVDMGQIRFGEVV